MITFDQVLAQQLNAPGVVLVDLREKLERERQGAIPGALHASYPDLQQNIQADGILYELANTSGKRLVFFCACGERSAIAAQATGAAGLRNAFRIHGGIAAWKTAHGSLVYWRHLTRAALPT